MTKQLSFSAHERRVIPQFRVRLNKAENTEEVKDAFVQTVGELLGDVLDETVELDGQELLLLPHSEPSYKIGGRLRSDPLLHSYWAGSDLPHVIQRLAEYASGRYKHLEKHPEKTELKIRDTKPRLDERI